MINELAGASTSAYFVEMLMTKKKSFFKTETRWTFLKPTVWRISSSTKNCVIIEDKEMKSKEDS
jgi:hypothetical protein